MKIKLHHRENKSERAFTIRPFEEKDAVEVIQCIKAEYGSTYFKKQLYDPEYVIKVNNENSLSFIVAETDEGVIAGVIGLKSFFPGETMCELATEIFKKEYRGYRLSEPMIQFGMRTIENRCYSSIYALPVTFHNISQRLLKRNGLVATGFICAVFVSEKVHSSYAYGRCLKHSQGIQSKSLEKKDVGKLFLAEEVKAMAHKIYGRLGVRYELPEETLDMGADASVAASKTMLFHSNDSNHSNCAITLLKIGSDLETQVGLIFKKYKSNPLQTFNVFMNINDSNAVMAYENLKDMGFFFTGFKALCSNDEYMVMHHRNGLKMHVEDYVLTDEFKELIADIVPFMK